MKASIAAYKVYTDAVEYAKTYIEEHKDELEGEYLENLQSYLEDNAEPSPNFPNGTYQYIIDERNLNDEEIQDEAKFVELLLKMAIENGYLAGANISSLLVNADLVEEKRRSRVRIQVLFIVVSAGFCGLFFAIERPRAAVVALFTFVIEMYT